MGAYDLNYSSTVSGFLIFFNCLNIAVKKYGILSTLPFWILPLTLSNANIEIPSNNRVNNVSPGMIATPMSQEVLGDETTASPFVKQTPLQRVGQSEDVALWLLSEDARFVTGQSILVEGGYTIGGFRP
ncbi:SDR family NAD(P)-dependent oxidoreductase [Paenibacillus aestuarii]|uniref:SDR family NAD(P)-dependent oxidoreductase n=1 Tax=Paenibacillus aestuarii TaxID=516965 RepID=A0ABW0KHL0_9BACL